MQYVEQLFLRWLRISMQDVIRVSARTVCQQLHREGYYSRVAVHKPLITKMNAHFRVQWYRDEKREKSKDVNHMLCPDINPTEHLWEILEQCVRQRLPPPSSKHQMVGISSGRMVFIPPVEFQRLVESMPRCTEAVLTAQHLNKILYVGFSFNLSPVCVSS